MNNYKLGDTVLITTIAENPVKARIVSKRTIKTYFGLYTNYDVEIEELKILNVPPTAIREYNDNITFL